MANVNIKRNARVVAGGEELGRVTHVIVDPQTREVTEIVVRRVDLEWLVPIRDVVTVEGDRLVLSDGASSLRSRRGFDRSQYHAVDDERARDESEQQALRGGVPLLDARTDAVEVGVPNAISQTNAPPLQAEPDTATVSEQPYHLQLREERLRVLTELEAAGQVRIAKRVLERDETITVPLREERLLIERLSGGDTSVTVDGRELAEGESVEVTIYAEHAEVVKEAVVHEQVAVRKEVVERQEQLRATLRREELTVEREGDLETTVHTPHTTDGTQTDPSHERSQVKRE